MRSESPASVIAISVGTACGATTSFIITLSLYAGAQLVEVFRAGFDAASKEKAQTLITSFRQFIDDHKNEIEALQVLYSQPYRAGLRYSQVKELAKQLQQSPHRFDPLRLWQAYKTVEPAKVKADGGKQLVDVIALVRHALDPATALVPVAQSVEERYEQWHAEQAAAGRTFTPDQRRWLNAIKDHVATSLAIETDDLDEVPFNQIGGLGRAYELFGDKLPALLAELNGRLAA
jgi:type I restriction enzyme R subunit